MRFFEFLIENSDGEVYFKYDQVKKMWELFVSNSNCLDESKLFYLYLMVGKENFKDQNNEFSFINDPVCKELYINYFLNEEKFVLEFITLPGYLCFKAFFIRYNVIMKKIKIEKTVIGISEKAIGMGTLWSIAFNAVNNEVIDMLNKLD